MATTTLTLDIDYDPELTHPEGLASAMDRLLETALSTPGIMEEYGDPRVGEFFVAADGGHPKTGPTVVVEISGGVLQEAYSSDPAVQLRLVDYDTEGCARQQCGDRRDHRRGRPRPACPRRRVSHGPPHGVVWHG